MDGMTQTPFIIKKISLFAVISLLVTIILANCGLSLSQDVTPPPGAMSYTAEDASDIHEVVFPSVLPDPGAGEVIYQESCALCHGATGFGDGPQAGGLPVPVARLGDPDLAFQARPVDWFNVVTNGSLKRYMPGFSSLDDHQRWDVVAYTLTLVLDADEIEHGRKLYERKCQTCHGEAGHGSAEAPILREEASLLMQYSIQEILSITANGRNGMPAFADWLSEAELRAVTVYTRTLGFVNYSNQSGIIAADSPAGAPSGSAANRATFQGEVTNASGGALPDGLQAVLSGYDRANLVTQLQTEVKDGIFRFSQVEISPGQSYLVTIEHQGLTFASDRYTASETTPGKVIELPVDFYETTTDASALRADRMHILFDFSNAETVQVVELFILNNTGNRVIIPQGSSAGVVNYELPVGATNLQLDDSTLGERYLRTDKGFTDTASIQPGSGQQVLFGYELPYQRETVLEIPIPIDVGAAVVMVPQSLITLKSDQLVPTGQREVQGVSLDLYTASALPGGSTLKVELLGQRSRLSFQAGGISSTVIGTVSLAVVLLGAGYWLMRQRKAKSADAVAREMPAKETVEDLMDAIIALDDRFQAGDLPEEAYLSRRKVLKERLKARMG